MRAVGTYVVAVTRRTSSDAFHDLRPIRDAPLRVIEHDDLQAVVCDVDLEEFGEEALRHHLENLFWVEEMARAHHDAVCAVGHAGTVVPMRFATIYASDARVREQLVTLGPAFGAALDRVDGCAEWSVKVYGHGGGSDPEEGQTRPVSGVEYLQRRRQAVDSTRAREDQESVLAATVHQQLAGLAVATRLLPSQDRRLTQRAEPMRLNAAFLVRLDLADAFQESARAKDDPAAGLRVEVDGPWPPYSFASLET